jgi:hypothetical protein
MSLREYRFLRAEVAELDKLIAMTPESAVIDQMSLEYRRSQVQEELDAFPVPYRWPVTARLTFNGGPVANGPGIDADFGSKAIEAFSNAVASAGASQVRILKERGPIPDRKDYRLRITSTALGSFGFEIEESGERNMPALGPSPVEMGIEQVKDFLKASVGNDEALADAIADAQQRALSDLRQFLKIMVDNRAVCSLSFQDDYFRFSDTGQVRRSLDKLSYSNIHEETAEISGAFLGYLPKNRQVEFWNEVTGDVIAGKVYLSVDNAEEINRILHRSVSIRVRTRRVGNGSPRYTVIGFLV